MGPMFGFVAGCLVFTTGLFAASGIVNGFVFSLFALFNVVAPSWACKPLIRAALVGALGRNQHAWSAQDARVLERARC